MNKKIRWILLAVAVVVLAGAAVAGWKLYKYAGIDTIYPGVSVEGVELGEMSVKQAKQAVQQYVENISEKEVVLFVGDKEKSFSLSQAGLSCDVDDAVEEAYQAGRTGNIFHRLLEIYQISKGKDILLHFDVDEKQMSKLVRKKSKRFETEKKDARISRKDGEFVIKDEVDGITVDWKTDMKKLTEQIESAEWDRGAIRYEMTHQVDPAEHKAEELKDIKDTLGTFTTSYAGSSEGRCMNVVNGAEHIDGTIVYPGETMSVHDKVAPMTAENGYHLAGSYENGKTVQTYGGGICQVSTTLYNAVLRAELEIVERQNHSMTVHYVDLSEDAAIAGTEKDLKFKNNLDTPIFIEGKAGGGTITFTVYGKEYRDANRSIEFVSECTSTRSPSEKIVKDKTLEEGKKVVEQSGVTGYTARLWKIIYVNGKETDRIQINSSSYISVPAVVRVGTKKPEEKKEEEEDDKSKKKKKDTSEKSDGEEKPDEGEDSSNNDEGEASE